MRVTTYNNAMWVMAGGVVFELRSMMVRGVTLVWLYRKPLRVTPDRTKKKTDIIYC